MNPLAASLPNRQRVPGFPLQHMGNNHARRLPKPPTPGRLQSDALHQRPLILSLSKDAGSSLTWFDRLTMSSLGRTLQSSCRQHRAQSNADIQTACSVQGPEASRCLCLSACLRLGGSPPCCASAGIPCGLASGLPGGSGLEPSGYASSGLLYASSTKSAPRAVTSSGRRRRITGADDMGTATSSEVKYNPRTVQ